MPNIDFEKIAAECAEFQALFLEKYQPIYDLLEQSKQISPALYSLIRERTQPLEDFIRSDFQEFNTIAGRAAGHGWQRGCLDGERTGALNLLTAIEDFITEEKDSSFMTKEDWLEFIRVQKENIYSLYLKQTGGLKVRWDET